MFTEGDVFISDNTNIVEKLFTCITTIQRHYLTENNFFPTR